MANCARMNGEVFRKGKQSRKKEQKLVSVGNGFNLSICLDVFIFLLSLGYLMMPIFLLVFVSRKYRLLDMLAAGHNQSDMLVGITILKLGLLMCIQILKMYVAAAV